MIRAATALAVLSICVALVVVLRGAMRYFYLQRLMTKKMGRYKCAGVMGIGLLAGLGLVVSIPLSLDITFFLVLGD